MTIKELRKMFTKRVEHLCEPSLKGYYEVCWGALETLYEVGELNVRKNYYIPDEIMSLAHAYESGRKIKGFTVVQSLDLMYIYATKKQARDLMGMFLGIETEQTAKPEPEQLEETVAEPEQEKAESEAPEQATAETETAEVTEPKQPVTEQKIAEACNSESVRELIRELIGECAPLKTVLEEIERVLEENQQKSRHPPIKIICQIFSEKR